ncbi:MAG: hypothetical protein OXQ29_04950 [Rhodospirillaceae bacterium]|nr:hypothetical protein [Rhodospirillaceae bacterium]
MFLRLLMLAALLGWIQVAVAEHDGREHVIPLFIADMDPDGRQGFVMVTNHSDEAGTAYIYGVDDAGMEVGPAMLDLESGETQPFNSEDLENGNESKGLTNPLPDGQGNWRLHIHSTLDIEPLNYIRTGGGFLSAMNDYVAGVAPGHRVPIFNPASNTNIVSWLRLINPGDTDATVTITARDQAGADAPDGAVTLTLGAREARRVTAQELEMGGSGLTGNLGDGAGKWSLWVSADQAIWVMNMMDTMTGELSNLSGTNRGYLAAAGIWQIRFADGNGGVGHLMLLSNGRLYALLPETADVTRIARGTYSSSGSEVEGTGVVYESGKIDLDGLTPVGGADNVTVEAEFGAGDWIRGSYTVEGEDSRSFHGWAFTGFGRGGATARVAGSWRLIMGDSGFPEEFSPDADGFFDDVLSIETTLSDEPLDCGFTGTLGAVNPAFSAFLSNPVIDCVLLAFGGEGNEDEVEVFMAVMDAPDKPGEASRAILFALLPREDNEIGLSAMYELTP